MPIKAIIIDDERLARNELKKLLEQYPDISIIDEASNVDEGVEKIDLSRPDLIFLDIQMPNTSGIDLLKKLNYSPLVIFTTAHSDYAVKGFELDIVDFLLKPFSKERFMQACSKVHKLLNNHQDQLNKFLFVRDRYSSIKLAFADILFIEASGNYVNIHLQDKRILARLTMSYLEKILEGNVFKRVHRSFIVNIFKIDKIKKGIILIGKQTIPANKDFDLSSISV